VRHCDTLLGLENVWNRKAIWTINAYDTGKTYQASLIKHLLKDELSGVRLWLDKYTVVMSLLAEHLPRK